MAIKPLLCIVMKDFIFYPSITEIIYVVCVQVLLVV
jgi:hypothetical protein